MDMSIANAQGLVLEEESSKRAIETIQFIVIRL